MIEINAAEIVEGTLSVSMQVCAIACGIVFS